MRVWTWVAALTAAGLLSACSSLPVAPERAQARFDAAREDVAGALYVLDLPTSLEPAATGPLLALGAGGASGGPLRADVRLVPADASEAMASLPPPAAGRNFYLFEVAAADRDKLRAEQAGLAAAGSGVALGFQPGLCRTEPVDLAKTRVSALAVAAGGHVGTLLDAVALAELLKSAPIKDVPPCAGHSG